MRKTALITGASKRIGRSIAIKLAELDYDIVITFNNAKKETDELKSYIEKNYSVRVGVLKADLRKRQEVTEVIDHMKKNYQNWSLLINNASIFNRSKFLDQNCEIEFQDNLSIHLLSPIFLIQEFTKIVRLNKINDAQIINLLDKNIARFDTHNFYYLLTKKFLASATQMMALEIAPDVRINGIAPGLILADQNSDNPQKEIEHYSKIIPLKKIGELKNITDTIEFILKNNFITGQIIAIDGGASLNHAG